METVRKSYTFKFQPTSDQERALAETLWHCRTLANTALEQRIFLWKQRGVTISRYEQEAELKDLRTELPDYAAMPRHVMPEVLARLDQTYQAFVRRVKAGQTPGFPRFQARTRYHSFTYKE